MQKLDETTVVLEEIAQALATVEAESDLGIASTGLPFCSSGDGGIFGDFDIDVVPLS